MPWDRRDARPLEVPQIPPQRLDGADRGDDRRFRAKNAGPEMNRRPPGMEGPLLFSLGEPALGADQETDGAGWWRECL